jgi:hypothetical protein
MKKAVLLISALFLVLGCSEEKSSKPSKPKTQDMIVLDNLSVSEFQVVDEAGAAVAGAEILVGSNLNDPFQGNLVKTDASGKAEAPKDWKTELPVTVHAPGYVAITYLGQAPHSLAFKLKKAPTLTRMELAGETSGYPIKDRDGFVDFGVVMKGLSKAEIIAFDINKVLSPEYDSFSVAGQQMFVPTNISLPRQKETYIIPVTLEKNAFRVFFQEPGSHKVLGIRGKFPFRDVVDQMRAGKGMADLINYFSLEGGTLQTVNISSPKQVLNFNMSEITFNSSVPVVAPRVANGEVVVALAGQQVDGVLMPTDVKKIAAGQSMNLKTTDASKALVVKVLKRESEFNSTVAANNDRLSAVMAPASDKSPTEFLSLVENPKLQGTDLILDAPKAVPGIEAYSTYLILSELQTINDGSGGTIKIPLHRWEVYAPGWINQMTLPRRPFSELANPQWRWEVSFLGGKDSVPAMGPEMIEKTTHVTRSSVDF